MPICRVLSQHACGIAPSSYCAYRSRPPSARALADRVLLGEVVRVQQDQRIGRGLYGARKVWLELRREGGITFLLVEHDMDVVMRASDRVIVLANGRVICEGTPDEVRRDPRVIDAYLGAHPEEAA